MQDCAKYRVLPSLINALEFGSASPRVLSAMLSIGGKLSSEEFTKLIVPNLEKMFASSDRGIRAGLLKVGGFSTEF